MRERRLEMAIRVLVVDDERSVADSLVLILNYEGCIALAAYSGIDAVRVARDFNPQILISDVMMPGMSGIEVMRSIVEDCPECQVLLISGYAEAVETATASLYDGHQVKILCKPVPPQVILEFIANCKNA